MPDELPRTAPCPHCGAATEGTWGVCANCDAELTAVWPPAVAAEPPEARPAQRGLLTGTSRLDNTIGEGLAWVILICLGKLFVFVYQIYSYHLISLGFTGADWRDVLLWLSYATLSVAATGGVYLLTRRSLPDMGRGFGLGLLILGGLAFAAILWLELFP